EIRQAQGDSPLRAPRGERTVDEPGVVTARRDRHVRQRAEGLRRELAPKGRVSPAHHRDEPILEQRRAPETLAHRVERADRDVELTAVEKIEDVEGSARPQIEL